MFELIKMNHSLRGKTKPKKHNKGGSALVNSVFCTITATSKLIAFCGSLPFLANKRDVEFVPLELLA